MVLLLNAIVCQGPEAFETLFYQCWSWKCFKYSVKRRAAKWRLHETDKTRDSLFAQLIKKLNHWDHRISNVGRGVSIRETLIEDCFKSWSLELCIFRKSDAWLLKKIGTPWAVFSSPSLYDKDPHKFSKSNWYLSRKICFWFHVQLILSLRN